MAAHDTPCQALVDMKETIHDMRSSFWKLLTIVITVCMGMIGCTSVMTPYYMSRQDEKFERHRELIEKEQESTVKNRESIVRLQSDIAAIKNMQQAQSKAVTSISEAIHRIELGMQRSSK